MNLANVLDLDLYIACINDSLGVLKGDKLVLLIVDICASSRVNDKRVSERIGG